MRDSWAYKQVSEFGSVITGSTPSTKSQQFWDGEYAFYSPADFKGQVCCGVTERTITKEGLNSGRILEENSILFTCIGSIGKMAIASNVGISNQQINAVIVNDFFDYKFIYYLLYLNKSRFINIAPMTTIQIINKTDFSQFSFKVPPLPQQKKIAQILSTCDTVLEQTEAAIAKYQALKQGMLHDLFTRGIDLATGQLRPKYEDAPELYKETELGFVPREWEPGKITDCVELLKSGLSRLLSHQDIGIPVVISGNIQNNQMDLKSLKYWYFKDPQGANTQNYILEKGDILLCFINSIDQIGKLAIFEGYQRPCIYTTNLFRIKSNDRTDSYFLYYLLVSNLVQNQIKSITKPAVNQASFTTKEFLNISVPLVSSKEQIIIKTRLQSIDEKIHTEQQTLAKYTQLKAGLMQDLLSGAVGVENLIKD